MARDYYFLTIEEIKQRSKTMPRKFSPFYKKQWRDG